MEHFASKRIEPFWRALVIHALTVWTHAECAIALGVDNRWCMACCSMGFCQA